MSAATRAIPLGSRSRDSDRPSRVHAAAWSRAILNAPPSGECPDGRRIRSQSVEVQDREGPRKRTAMKPFQASAGAVGTHTSGGRVLRCHRSGDCDPATTAPATSLGSESGCIRRPTDPPTHARGSQGQMLSAPRTNRPAAEPQPAGPRVANSPGTGSSVAIEVHALGSPIRL